MVLLVQNIQQAPDDITAFCFNLKKFMLHLGINSSILLSLSDESIVCKLLQNIVDQYLVNTFIIIYRQQTMDKQKYKYNKLLSPQQLGFMQYFMLPQKDQFQYIYRPGDDSFLMLSVLKNQCINFGQHPLICEIGSGSGILSVHLNKWMKQLNNQPAIHVATDISLDACIFSCKYYQQYNINVQQICTSLLKGLNYRPNIIVCNPPYVPTDQQQKLNQVQYLREKITAVIDKCDYKRSRNKNLIAYSYMGGPEGLDTTRLLIKSISWQTKLYIIVMGQEGLQILREQVEQKKIIQNNIKAEFQVMQFYKKINQQLYVVLISTKFI